MVDQRIGGWQRRFLVKWVQTAVRAAYVWHALVGEINNSYPAVATKRDWQDAEKALSAFLVRLELSRTYRAGRHCAYWQVLVSTQWRIWQSAGTAIERLQTLLGGATYSTFTAASP